MEQATRRNFLAIVGAGAAVGVTATVVPSGLAGSHPVSLSSDVVGPLAAYVDDIRADEVLLLIEGHQVVVKDRELVARLASAFSAAHH